MDNLILGPSVVNNLGFSRGYWQIMSSEPVTAADRLDTHLFVRFKGTGRPDDYDLVDEAGAKVHVKRSQADTLLAQSGIGNYNLIDWRIQETSFEFRAGVFNLTNTPNFGQPGNLTFTNTNTFASISTTRDNPNDPRELQFSLKYYF